MSDDLLARLLTAVTALGAKFEALDAKVEGLRVEQAQTRAELLGVMERLQDSVTDLRQESWPAAGASQEAEIVARSTRHYAETTAERVNSLHQLWRRLDERVRHLEERKPAEGGPHAE
jgi:hypothetical protein